VFIGTWGAGVFRAPLDPPPFELLATRSGGGLRNVNVTAVLGGAEAGRPWVGSFGGGPQRADVRSGEAEPSPAGDDDRLPMSGIVSLARAPNGRVFAGATEGLFSFDARGGGVQLDRHVSGRDATIGPGYVSALLPWGRGQLLVGVGGSGLHVRDAGGRFRAFRHDPGQPDSPSGDYVTALAPGTDGRVWVGTRSDGLNVCRIEPFQCQRIPAAQGARAGLSNHHVTSLRTGPGGELWVATDGGGIHRIQGAAGDDRTIQRWGAAEGVIDDGVMAVELDDDGSLWLSTRHGLARLDPVSGRVVNHVPESGLPTTHFNTGASSSDAAFLYFGSVDGLVSLPKGTPFGVRSATPVTVTAVDILDASAAKRVPQGALDDGFRVRYGDGLAIEFAVLDFAESTHEYAYRMQADAGWTALGQRRQVTFLGLEPGQYRFEVRGRDVFGQWNDSEAIAFEVVPPIWMTTWFRTLAGLLLAMLALALHLGRTRALKARNAVLENLKEQREYALERARTSQRELEEAYAGLRQLTTRLESAKEDERARISRELHDEFGQTLTAAKITLQLLRQGTGDATVAEGLAQSVAMVDGMIRQARDIARGLRPPLLDEAGLVPALDHYLKSAAARAGIPIDLQAEPSVAEAPRALDTTVFRLVQEAVSNALRHAGARAIRVQLGRLPEALRIVVEDDGVGFDPSVVNQKMKRGEHLGLLGMTERVHGFGGRIEFESRPGAGTRIVVQLPFAGVPQPADRPTESPA
jgi:signal transduction histidine kinase